MQDNEELLYQFTEERECEYKGRRYLVRDNGAVYRLRRIDGRASKWDEIWTFGRKDDRTGYMFIGEARVHRIVCYAYHGEPVGEQKWVDHIDTNRCNNRPDNLRWVTELENILLNPITRAKVEMICGSVESFLENPNLLYGHESENPHFEWMRTVSKEESENSLKRWKEWSERSIEERKSPGYGIGDSIYDNYKPVIYKKKPTPKKQEELLDSLTPGAKQLNLHTKTEFLLCPKENQERTLKAYMDKLVKEMPFAHSQYRTGYDSVLKWEYNTEEEAICLITRNAEYIVLGYGKPWMVWKITLRDGFFLHEFLGKFLDPNGAEREFTLAMGRRWRGGEVFDDYC